MLFHYFIIIRPYLALFQIHFDHMIVYFTAVTVSGHSQLRPPSLRWPNVFATATVNAFLLLPLTKGHLSKMATISLARMWPY